MSDDVVTFADELPETCPNCEKQYAVSIRSVDPVTMSMYPTDATLCEVPARKVSDIHITGDVIFVHTGGDDDE